MNQKQSIENLQKTLGTHELRQRFEMLLLANGRDARIP